MIGLGGAGVRIASALREADAAAGGIVGGAHAFDTDDAALATGSAIPESNRHRIGETDGGLDGDLQRGFETGKDRAGDLTGQLLEEHGSDADAMFVAIGLGGATGGGVAPAFVATLQRAFDGPVYVLATLPADDEFAPGGDAAGADRRRSAGGTRPARPRVAANAVRTLERLDGLASAVVCFDNEEWLRRDESVAEARERLNGTFAERVAALLAAGSEATADVAESAIDEDDVERVLGNRTELATIGHGAQKVDAGGSRFGLGLFSSTPDVETAEAVSAVETAVGKAVRGRLTFECERESAERAMLIVGGPPAWLERRAVADAQRDLESTIDTRSIVGGDAPRPDGDAVFSVVVFAGVDPGPRLDRLREAAGEQARADD